MPVTRQGPLQLFSNAIASKNIFPLKYMKYKKDQELGYLNTKTRSYTGTNVI